MRDKLIQIFCPPKSVCNIGSPSDSTPGSYTNCRVALTNCECVCVCGSFGFKQFLFMVCSRKIHKTDERKCLTHEALHIFKKVISIQACRNRQQRRGKKVNRNVLAIDANHTNTHTLLVRNKLTSFTVHFEILTVLTDRSAECRRLFLNVREWCGWFVYCAKRDRKKIWISWV